MAVINSEVQNLQAFYSSTPEFVVEVPLEGHYIWRGRKKISSVASLEKRGNHSRAELHNLINGQDLNLGSMVQINAGLEVMGSAKTRMKLLFHISSDTCPREYYHGIPLHN